MRSCNSYFGVVEGRTNGMDRNLRFEKVLNVKMRSEEIWFDMKCAGSVVPKEALASKVIEECPQLVIAFYEGQVKWTGRPPQEPKQGWNLRGFLRKMPEDKILDATINSKGETIFLMKWKYTTITNFVLASEANEKCPEVVIAFYESKCRWGASDSNGERRLRGCKLAHTSEMPMSLMDATSL